jgi:hypothetical protein
MTVPREVKLLLAFLENSQQGEFSLGYSFKMYFEDIGLHPPHFKGAARRDFFISEE